MLNEHAGMDSRKEIITLLSEGILFLKKFLFKKKSQSFIALQIWKGMKKQEKGLAVAGLFCY